MKGPSISNEYVTVDKEIAGGVPVFKNTRVTVNTLFDYLVDSSIEEFLEGFPSISREQVEVVIDKSMRDFSTDPTFLKRAEEASEFLQRVGLPESFIKK
jgi:uncharacterized protein (DUF433 family)